MSPEQFLREFGHLAETVEGPSQLRKTIRQLAVMGRLSERGSRDGEAGELIADTVAYRKERLGKKAKAGAPIGPEDSPYDLPDSWAWVRLGELCWRSQYGTSQKAHVHDDGIPVLRMGNIVEGTLELSSMKFVPEDTDGIDDLILEDGDLVFNRTNSYEQVGKMAVYRKLERPYTLASYLIRLSLCPGIVADYINIYFGSPTCRMTQIEPGITKQTNQANFNGTKLAAVLIPLPPLPEQKRIVEKVDQLMALCDELEAKQKQKREKTVSFNQAALNAVVLAPDKSALKSAWSRVQDHFEVLYELPENVKELRLTILQLAVTGKLVEHGDSDSAQTLLDSASEQQESAIHAGTHKRAKGLDQVPHDKPVPETWRLTRLADILTFGPRNGLSPRGVEHETGTRVLTLSATTSGSFEPGHYKNVVEDIEETSHLWLRSGDVLIQRGNSLDYVGVAALVAETPKGYIYPDLMMKLRFCDGISPAYMTMLLNSPPTRTYFRENASGTSGNMPKINQQVVNNTLVGLPPAEEQARIVERVNQVMALCDKLDAASSSTRQTGRRLMQSIVEGLVA